MAKKYTLPQHDTDRRSERDALLEKQRRHYRWADPGIEGLPPHIAELPLDKKINFNTQNLPAMFVALAGGWVTRHKAYIEKYIKELNLIEHYRAFYLPADTPSVAKRWSQDREFGRQRLAGVNPAYVRLLTELPDHFRVTDADVAGVLEAGETLASMMDQHRLYWTDYSIIDGIPAQEGRFLCAPMVLLAVNRKDQLVPIAVQMHQTPGPDAPIFTPKDDPWLWKYVKMHCQAADAAYHEVAAHLLCTHLVMEAFEVSMHRQLPACHPIHELLLPHFEDTLAINVSARQTMLAPGGPIDLTLSAGAAGSVAIAQRVWKTYRWDQAHLQTDLRARGVEDGNALPNYHYRDDSRLLWGAIGEFIAGMVRHLYKSDADVREDFELQAWLAVLAAPDGCNIEGMPNDGALNTRLELADFLTQIIYISSAQHASVNNGQYDLFGFVPNVPGHMLSPAPSTKDPLSEEFVARSLPYKRASEEQIGFTEVLSAPTKMPLGGYAKTFFDGDPAVHEHIARFQARLRSVGQAIDARNARLEVPYTYMHPKTVAQSIEI